MPTIPQTADGLTVVRISISASACSWVAVNVAAAFAAKGWKVGLFRPVTLWPFPIDALTPLLGRARRIVVVEAGPGQIEDELRLALSHAGVSGPAIESVRRFGGVLPQPREIVEKVLGGPQTGPEVSA